MLFKIKLQKPSKIMKTQTKENGACHPSFSLQIRAVATILKPRKSHYFACDMVYPKVLSR